MVVDVIAGIILLASTVISILRGLVREVLTIFGIVGGAVASYVGGPLLSPVIKGWMGLEAGKEEPEKLLDIIPYETLADGLSYAAIFVAFVIIFSIISYFLTESIRNIGLGALDRTLGMVFGLVRGVLFLGILYLPIYYLADEEQIEEWSWLQSSRSRVYLEATSGWIAGFIPAESVESITEATQELGEKAGEVNEVRQKLQEMDLLKTEEETEEPSSALTPLPEGLVPGSEADGYSEETRSKMDELFERMIDTEEQE